MFFLSHSGYNYSERRCERIVQWFVNEYLPRHKFQLHIAHKGLLREGVFGWTWTTDSQHRPREFEVEIHNRMNPEEYTKTLLHELWHVQQHVRGTLKDKHNKMFWLKIASGIMIKMFQNQLCRIKVSQFLFIKQLKVIG